jgi:hypothetical protein
MTDYDNCYVCEWCGYVQEKDEVYDNLLAKDIEEEANNSGND